MVIPSDEINTLKREVLYVTNETSDKFVLAPTKEHVLSDLIIGLKRFRNTVRWKCFFQEEKRKKNELQNSPLSQTTLNDKFNFSEENDVDDENVNLNINEEEGLKSGLTPGKTTQNAPIGSPEVESFLKEVEQQLITQVNEEDFSFKKKRDKTIVLLLENLRKSDQVVIATDKTNSFQVIPIEKYKIWVLGHLNKSAKEIERKRLVEIFEVAQETKTLLEETLSEKEYMFLSKTLESKSIPTPKLIIKDHKKMDKDGDYPF